MNSFWDFDSGWVGISYLAFFLPKAKRQPGIPGCRFALGYTVQDPFPGRKTAAAAATTALRTAVPRNALPSATAAGRPRQASRLPVFPIAAVVQPGIDPVGTSSGRTG